MNVIVIGNGSIGMRHADNLSKMNHSVSIIDSDPAATSYAKLNRKLDGQDAAVICVPTNQHLPMLEHCLSKSLPAYVEKPLGNYAQLDQLRELSLQRNLPRIMVGYQLRFHQNIHNYVTKHGKNSIIGGDLKCFCDMSTWKGQSGKGDFLLEMSHEIDLAMYLGAKELTSSKFDLKRRYALMEFDDVWSVELRGSSNKYKRSWMLNTSEGNVKYLYNDPTSLGNEMYEDSMRHFMKAVRTKSRLVHGCTLSQAVNVMDVVQKVSNSK